MALEKDFFDLQIPLNCAEVELISSKTKLHGFPSKYGFLGELLLLNQEKKISIQLVGKNLIVKRGSGIPDFLKEKSYENAFNKWKENSLKISKDSKFIIGGDFVSKVTIYSLFSINFILAIVIIPFLIFSALEGAFWIPWTFVNLILIGGYYFLKKVNYPKKQESFLEMRDIYNKSIILNVIVNKLKQARFEKETNLNYFLLYGPYGAFAIASHSAEKLDLDDVEIVIK